MSGSVQFGEATIAILQDIGHVQGEANEVMKFLEMHLLTLFIHILSNQLMLYILAFLLIIIRLSLSSLIVHEFEQLNRLLFSALRWCLGEATAEASLLDLLQNLTTNSESLQEAFVRDPDDTHSLV